jgi:hypothetical protein
MRSTAQVGRVESSGRGRTPLACWLTLVFVPHLLAAACPQTNIAHIYPRRVSYLFAAGHRNMASIPALKMADSTLKLFRPFLHIVCLSLRHLHLLDSLSLTLTNIHMAHVESFMPKLIPALLLLSAILHLYYLFRTQYCGMPNALRMQMKCAAERT